jgi:hypothetical protein
VSNRVLVEAKERRGISDCATSARLMAARRGLSLNANDR